MKNGFTPVFFPVASSRFTCKPALAAAPLRIRRRRARGLAPKACDAWGGINRKEISEAHLSLRNCVWLNDSIGATAEMKNMYIPYQQANNSNFRRSSWTKAGINACRPADLHLRQGFIPAVNNQEMNIWLLAQGKSFCVLLASCRR